MNCNKMCIRDRKVSVEGAHTELKVEVFVGNEKKEAVLAADASEVVVA